MNKLILVSVVMVAACTRDDGGLSRKIDDLNKRLDKLEPMLARGGAGAAAPQRQKLYADATAKGYFVAFTHVSFPGIGHVRKEGAGYEWIPVNYTNK